MEDLPLPLPDDLSFEDWLDFVFNHNDLEWHWNIGAPHWDETKNADKALAYMTRLFLSPHALLERFTKDQVGTGLNFIVSNICSSHAFAMIDTALPITDRLACVRAISNLYEDLFARICEPHLQHRLMKKLPGDTEAEYVCYMLWDVIPLYPRTKNMFSKFGKKVRELKDDLEQIEAACLDAMEQTLRIDHVACQEGALHGLGHWATSYRARVRSIVDDYLRRPRSSELTSYAKAARKGMVQ
jgi:hypothetical protein